MCRLHPEQWGRPNTHMRMKTDNPMCAEDLSSGRELESPHLPWGDIRALRVQDLDFVAVIKVHGL